MADGLTADWQAPWLSPWRPAGAEVARLAGTGLPLHEALNQRARPPVAFAPAESLPAGTAYEQFIFETGQVPTRPNLHDFFNGLCWLTFPRTKRRLNEMQAAAISQDGVGAVRGPLRDAITVFDENAALLHAPDTLWEALAAHEWKRAFIELRPLWEQAQLVLFGHALLEKLAQPRKEITAHVYRVAQPWQDIPALDAWLAADLSPGKLAGKPFTPLPVLGVPGWHAENANFSFYDDSFVFRPRRAPRTT